MSGSLDDAKPSFGDALKAAINAAVQEGRATRIRNDPASAGFGAPVGEYFDLEADGCADEIALKRQCEARAQV